MAQPDGPHSPNSTYVFNASPSHGLLIFIFCRIYHIYILKRVLTTFQYQNKNNLRKRKKGALRPFYISFIYFFIKPFRVLVLVNFMRVSGLYGGRFSRLWGKIFPLMGEVFPAYGGSFSRYGGKISRYGGSFSHYLIDALKGN